MKILAVVLTLAAAYVTYRIYSRTFTPSRWAGHNDPGDTSNPRRAMVQDLLDHHLRPGMPRDSVLRLLGPPESEGLKHRLTYGPWPDSLRVRARHMPMDSLNRLIQASAFETVLDYPIGWTWMDGLSLIIRLDCNGRLGRAQVVEH